MFSREAYRRANTSMIDLLNKEIRTACDQGQVTFSMYIDPTPEVKEELEKNGYEILDVHAAGKTYANTTIRITPRACAENELSNTLEILKEDLEKRCESKEEVEEKLDITILKTLSRVQWMKLAQKLESHFNN